MSDDSFAKLDAILQQEADVVVSLSEENARLRTLLAERDAARCLPVNVPAASLDPAVLYAELQATKAAQAEMFRELKLMREANAARPAVEDHSDEVALLRESLADLATQLEQEKQRVTAIEAQRREEEEKVTTLRSKVEESRRAVMRLQNESSKARSEQQQQRAPSLFPDGYSFPPRRPSFVNTSAPRRRSSLGLVAITGSPSSPDSPNQQQAATQPLGVGLGFDLQSPTSASFPPLSTSPSGTATASHLARYAHRRGSASLSVPAAQASAPSSSEEEERFARLRELRLGHTSTKIHSRRNSAATGLPEFATPFDWDLERRFARRLSVASGSAGGRRARGSICEGDESDAGSVTGPPNANLRMLGRKDSVAVFESWSRRSSSTDSLSGWPSGSSAGGSSEYNADSAMADHLEDLHLQLQGLRIQLAESEEGRRASELCLQALKEFIAKQTAPVDAASAPSPIPISLPPLPSASSVDILGDEQQHRRPSARSRWSISRLSLSSSRRDSAQTPQAGYVFPAPSAQAAGRRTSTASTATTTSSFEPSSVASSSSGAGQGRTTPSLPSSGATLPSFGSFSFSALVSRPTSVVLVDADTSPTMSRPAQFASPCAGEFPCDPSPLIGANGSRAASTRSRNSGGEIKIPLPASAQSSPGETTSDECDGTSTAPSLVSDSLSSRGSSPELDGAAFEGFDESPSVVIGGGFDETDDAATAGDEVVLAKRMPLLAAAGKPSLLALGRAVGSATAAQ
ncbi:hypothetical protein JCM8097_009388 [Rhodosporidiobolus ruineniae]